MHAFLNSAINSLINHCNNERLGYVALLHTDDGHPNHTSSYVMMTWPLLFMEIHAKVPIEWEIAKM